MTIRHATEPFKLSPTRRRQRAAHAILQCAVQEPDLAAQARNAHRVVVIGGVRTHWSPPLDGGAPSYISTMAHGNERFIFIDPDPLNVAVYDGREDLWRGEVLTCLPDLILALLPKAALLPFGGEAEASSAQLAAIRRLLNLPSDHLLPRLHTSVASLVIERFALAPILPPLVNDFWSWTEATIDEDAA